MKDERIVVYESEHVKIYDKPKGYTGPYVVITKKHRTIIAHIINDDYFKRYLAFFFEYDDHKYGDEIAPFLDSLNGE